MGRASASLALVIALTALACRDKVRNPDYCRCELCVWRADGTCGVADAGGEGEGEVDGGEGEGEGECQPRCGDDEVCGPGDRCVTCYDDGGGRDPGCDEPEPPHCVGEACVFCADTNDEVDLGCTEGEPVCVGGIDCAVCRADEGPAPDPGCTDELPFCDGAACRQCLAHADCSMGNLLFCDPALHTCRDCDSGAECEARDAGNHACLADGTCAQCDDAADCGGRGCDPRTNACSATDPGDVGHCRACVSDLDCAVGSACVVVEWAAAEVGTYCAVLDCNLQPDPDLWCRGQPGLGSGFGCARTDTRAGSAVQACLPTTTTCEGYWDALDGRVCDDASNCGVAGAVDAVCVARAGDDYCSVSCSDLTDCPANMSSCDAVEDECRRP